MKIFVTYDGSTPADTAIDGLRRAGLPTQGVEALVMSVGEVWLPPATQDADESFPRHVPGLKESREYAEGVMQGAHETAERGAQIPKDQPGCGRIARRRGNGAQERVAQLQNTSRRHYEPIL